MKFIGQYIQDFIARFRSDVYLEDISSGTIASGGNLGLDSNNKIVKANEPTSHDAVTLAGTPDYITISGQEITRNQIDLANDVSGFLPIANGGTGAVNAAGARTSLGLGLVENKSSATIRGEIVSGDIPNNAADTSGNAATATALATQRDLQVDLAESGAGGFDGSGNTLDIGVGSSVLGVTNGGTGLTSISTLLNSNVPHYDYLHINCQMTAASTNQYMGYGGHYNFNIGANLYSDGGSVNNKNTTKWSHYQAISAATIHTVYYNFTTTGGSGNNFVFELWEIVPGSGSSNNTTNLIKQYSLSGNASNDFILTATDTTGYSLAAGAGLLPVIRKVTSAWSGNIFGEITIKFQY